jgi:hypothetical protein
MTLHQLLICPIIYYLIEKLNAQGRAGEANRFPCQQGDVKIIPVWKI